MIDLRSDTLTQPTREMLEAMFSARVGDDVFGEDETVNTLQEFAANMFGTEAALFCPSGTMTNQIAIKLHTQPGDEVLCDKLSHIYLFEGGGIAFNSGASVRLLNGHMGRFTATEVVENLNRDDPHFPKSALVAIENTVNRGGGSIWDFNEILKIRQACNEYGLKLHLDGARLFNALAETGEMPQQYGQVFDTISICLSKGLGAPVGSLLLGKKEHIYKARRIRKVFGGGMRQAGYMAAAGLYALQHHLQRIKTDHQRAAAVAALMTHVKGVKNVIPAQSNIVIFEMENEAHCLTFLQLLHEKGIKAVNIGRNAIRFVFHLDVSDAQFDELCDFLKKLS